MCGRNNKHRVYYPRSRRRENEVSTCVGVSRTTVLVSTHTFHCAIHPLWRAYSVPGPGDAGKPRRSGVLPGIGLPAPSVPEAEAFSPTQGNFPTTPSSYPAPIRVRSPASPRTPLGTTPLHLAARGSLGFSSMSACFTRVLGKGSGSGPD